MHSILAPAKDLSEKQGFRLFRYPERQSSHQTSDTIPCYNV